MITRTTWGHAAVSLIVLVAGPLQCVEARGPDPIVSAETLAEASALIDQAEAAAARGDLEQAYGLLQQARNTPYRNHSRGLASLSPRLMGDETFARLLEAQLATRTALGRQAEARGWVHVDRDPPGSSYDPWQRNSALTWYLQALNADEVLRLVETLPEDPFRHGYVHGTAANVVESWQYMAPLAPGYDYLPRERELRARFRDEVVPAIEARMRGFAARLLEEEAREFDKPMTDIERQYSTADMQALANQFTGLDDPIADPETVLPLTRARDSQERLREAAEWVRYLDEDAERLVRERAVDRGERMLAIARDELLPPTYRDEAYGEAEDYFYQVRARDRLEAARAAREDLRPALEAYQADRQTKMDAMEERLAADAEEIERAAEAMKKTEEEKRQFEEEADALEAELGF
jgi:hypothetical protein